MNEYRELTTLEQKRVDEQRKERTQAEKEAFRLLPDCMKEIIERNGPVAFCGHAAFYPDLLLRDAKIIIEIDGGIHRKYEQKRIDNHRNGVFMEHGYDIIRINNEDVCLNVAFWQRLVEGLAKINPIGIKKNTMAYIKELNRMIKRTSVNCLSLEEDDQYQCTYFPHRQWKQIGRISARHQLLLCI